MFSILVVPFLMLLSVFVLHLFLPQPQPTPLPAPTTIANETSVSTSTRAKEAAGTSREKSLESGSTTPDLRAPLKARSATPTPSRELTIPPATSVSRALLELIHEATNNERALHGLAPLERDATLSRIALMHSTDMLDHEYFSHEDQVGCSVSCRADAAGYAWRLIGENIFFTEGFTLDNVAYAEKVVQGWMASPGHRANILNDSYTAMGIGITERDRTVYTTAVYARPR